MTSSLLKDVQIGRQMEFSPPLPSFKVSGVRPVTQWKTKSGGSSENVGLCSHCDLWPGQGNQNCEVTVTIQSPRVLSPRVRYDFLLRKAERKKPEEDFTR